MKSPTTAVRRRLRGALGATARGGGVVAAVPSVGAAPDPCAAGSISKTVGKVAVDAGDYLDSHPETNDALTKVMQDQPGPQSLGAVKSYFDANPKAQADIQKISEPLSSLGTKCKLPVSLPQLLGAMQAAQNQGAVPALPGGLPAGPGTQAMVGAPVPGAVPVPAPGRAPVAGH